MGDGSASKSGSGTGQRAGHSWGHSRVERVDSQTNLCDNVIVQSIDYEVHYEATGTPRVSSTIHDLESIRGEIHPVHGGATVVEWMICHRTLGPSDQIRWVPAEWRFWVSILTIIEDTRRELCAYRGSMDHATSHLEDPRNLRARRVVREFRFGPIKPDRFRDWFQVSGSALVPVPWKPNWA
ncbi:hypothetical protein N7492_006586 [Penicillium capsulatum]|uniref:Uncharacterized protein n=1 Tax=Penicillium capsulatum TaxID=69766 RepID=A0A9W9LKU7_9EURO|nr:hypothetical protein N7492_006586 [Penicillium capsulatum]KAJ6116421.1 hypothetical protein N7512_006146 [Penicillium capsulatum]